MIGSAASLKPPSSRCSTRPDSTAPGPLTSRRTFICRADRVPELISLFDANGAGEAVLFPLWPRHSSPAGRVILQVRRDVEGPGAVLPGLVLHRDDGGFSDAAEPIMAGAPLPVVHPARPLGTTRRRAADSETGG